MLPSDGNINEFRARSIEMKAAVAEITKFAAREKVRLQNAKIKEKVSATSKAGKQKKNGSVKQKKKSTSKKKTTISTSVAKSSVDEKKVNLLQNEVLSLKQQLAAIAQPREADTIGRMGASDKKKAQGSASKLGIDIANTFDSAVTCFKNLSFSSLLDKIKFCAPRSTCSLIFVSALKYDL